MPPTLGYLENLEVLFAPGAATGEGVLTSPAPFVSPDAAWERLQSAKPWVGNSFIQKPGVALSAALGSIHPFRGECAGALQLSVLKGCLLSLGAEKLDALNPGFGPAFIGIWYLKAEDSSAKVYTLASRFLSQLGDVSADYTRGAVIGVPGDYLYFKNKDDYPAKAPAGGWQGENFIYMGQDALGGPHYSGLGLGWKTEFALRMFLGNTYMNDYNTDLIDELRLSKSSTIRPAIVENPLEQVRFTRRAVMRYPDMRSGPPPKMQLPQDVPNPFSNAEYQKRLVDLGFRAPFGDTGDKYLIDELPLQNLVDVLGFPEAALHQTTSAGMGAATVKVTLGHWTLVIQPKSPDVRHLSMNDRVDVVGHFTG